ncbi:MULTISPECIES: DUF2817 domain-containing protein [Burkholderia]|jgi:predicted deacylase|uniref:M14 family metallopeptidase n=2 Tax=Burkholderia gladioli TaxID=28095 RepID=A0AB38U5A0_BURGA|nr:MULTISPECIES: DUF2817 domain-containing protein [Burkholderia]KAF1058411.1 hypothetical protein LvStA_05006 [Burkholderia gladioli]MDD1785252.1 M14 family metallopeptidase [Burkholderia gladioli]MDN7461358.1 DUF2817 domain-containing protein [Burkholderia gladioli]MDN7495730.1 DUF2817 domain-containing protein [Burkholderia gladioli]MDN7598747.1 DUF2817 domain-containing protein [Burkholderia gladioli]
MKAGEMFSDSYEAARARFREAAARRGARLAQVRNPARGPDGVTLTTDVAWLGPAAASRVLVVVSGTHGVEGYAGSAIQCAWLAGEDAGELPCDAAVMLVHALNPFGFAWHRRVNEDNVDLNRNFIDWNAARPSNDGYDALHDALLTGDDDPVARVRADASLRDFTGRHGIAAFQEALSRGQYRHPDGLFYGGNEATWSARLIGELVRENLGHAADIALVDLHTGLGPYGEGQPVSFDLPGSAALARAQAWFGPALGAPRAGGAVSNDLDGTLYDAWRRWLFGRSLTSIALEFGTHPVPDAVAALRAEAVAWRNDPYGDSPAAARARAALRAFFDVPRDDWRESVLSGGLRVLRAALAGVTGRVLADESA